MNKKLKIHYFSKCGPIEGFRAFVMFPEELQEPLRVFFKPHRKKINYFLWGLPNIRAILLSQSPQIV